MSTETEQQQEHFPSDKGGDSKSELLPVSAFQSLERHRTHLASTIIVGPDSIRPGVARMQKFAEQENENYEAQEHDYGMISIEMPPGKVSNKLPPFVRSRADSIANAFSCNYTARPYSVKNQGRL